MLNQPIRTHVFELKIKIDELAGMPIVTVEQVFRFREAALSLLRSQLDKEHENV